MAITVRYFLFEESGALKHVPHRVSEGLHQGEDAIPAYAGTRQRVAEVVLDNEAGKPVRIRDARGRIWTFHDDGRLDTEDHLGWFRWLDYGGNRKRGKVVDLRPDIERRQWEQKHLWEVTVEDLDRIAAAVWPWAAGEPEGGGVEAIKGKAKKVPPLTHNGQEAFGKIRSAIHAIDRALEGLTEPALKGLAHELRRNGRVYPHERAIYDAAAAATDRQREIRARHRTGRGAWYAALHVWHWDDEKIEGNEIDTIEERHESRQAALEAARRLLAENVHRFDRNVTLEADVISELEWVPMEPRRAEFEASDVDTA